MKKHVIYSVLRYSPSAVADERINLGMVVYDELLNISKFRYTKQFRRINSFDDEIDISAVKHILQDIKDEIEGTHADTPMDVENFIRYYDNDFAFDSPKMIEYDDFDETFDRLFKIYFRFDFERKDRPDRSADIKLVEDIIKAQSIEYRRNQYVVGEFNERIRYDFVTPEHNIKVFDFDGKDLSKMINSAKVWAFNAMNTPDSDKLILMYRYSDKDEKSDSMFDSIMRIFKSSGVKFYDMDEGLQRINTLS